MPEKALAFIDLLGFSQMIKKDFNTAKNILNDFYNITYDLIKPKTDIQGKLFSDSLLSYSGDKTELVNVCCELYRKCLLKNQDYDYPKDSFFLMPRGGISIGLVDIQQRHEAPNLTKDFIVSPALVHSATMEKQIKGSRLLVAINLQAGNESSILWNHSIKTILYEHSTLSLWENYQYNDALWFVDLNKSDSEQESEIKTLIEISSDLLLAARSPIAIEQHSGTLRIGLLSLSRFFNANMTYQYFTDLINKFRDDKYWQVWFALFEMALQSPDAFALPIRQDINDFHKEISIKASWKKVIDEINKQGNSYIKRLFENFVRHV